MIDKSETPPTVLWSPYATTGYNRVASLCEGSFHDIPGMGHLAYYDEGLHVFAVGRQADADAIHAVESAFVQLLHHVKRFNEDLSVLKTGGLIRTVVGSPGGFVHCGHVWLEEFLVGVTRDPALADGLDEKVSKLVTRVRKEVYQQGDQDPGGDWEKRVTDLETPSSPHYVPGDRLDEEWSGSLREWCSSAVNSQDLHYVALHLDGGLVLSADVFDSAQLEDWFGTDTVRSERRKQYLDVAAQMHSDIEAISYSLRLFMKEPIDRLVLDVVAGAVYVYPLASRQGFLLGVTVFQREVAAAEERLRRLLPKIEHLLRPENRYR